MTRILAIVFAVGISLAAASAADAAGGCGIGWHRGPYGGCRRDYVGGPVVVAPVVVGPRAVIVEPGRVCPYGTHLGPYGHCRTNY